MAWTKVFHLVRLHVLDWLFVLLFGLVAPLVFSTKSFYPHVRKVPLDDPSYRHEHIPDIVPVQPLLLATIFIPITVFMIIEAWAHVKKMSTISTEPSYFAFIKFHTFLLGLFQAIFFTIFVTDMLKLVTGRPRPYFATVCQDYITTADGTKDMTQCTGDFDAVKEARKSFPSGHTSLAFSAAVFLACYLYAKFISKDDAPRRLASLQLYTGASGYNPSYLISPLSAASSTYPSDSIEPLTFSVGVLQILIILTPLVAAFLVGISRTRDHHHHYSDVLAGALLGSTVAGLVFAVLYGQYRFLLDGSHELSTNQKQQYQYQQYQADDMMRLEPEDREFV